MIHNLKILPEYFEAVTEGIKTFEIRKNDRDFKVGDLLKLREYDTDLEDYTGSYTFREIVYMTNYEQKDGYVVLGVKKPNGFVCS